MSPQIAAAATRLLAPRPELARTRSEDLPWLPSLEQTADPALGGAAAERVLARLEQVLPPGEKLSADPLLLWLPRAAPPLRPRIGG